MALGTLVQGGTGGGVTSGTTTLFTPTANAHVYAVTAARLQAADLNKPTVGDSVGLTWNEITDAFVAGVTGRARTTLWYAVVGGSPAAMTVSGTCSNAASTGVWAGYITGADTDYANVASGNNNAGDPTATLGSSPLATSTVMAVCGGAGTANITEPSGHTQISEFTANLDLRLSIGADAGSASASGAWTSNLTRTIGILVEIKEAGGVGAVTGTVAATAQVVPSVVGAPVVTGTVVAQAQIVAAISARGVITGTVGASAQVTSNIQGTVGGAVAPEFPVELLQSPFIANLGRMM